jgi:hypothetical protein
MKNIKFNSLFTVLISISLFLSSCSTDFIESKQELSSVGVEIYQDEILATQYLDYLYYSSMPVKDQNLASYSLTAAEAGNGELFTKATDEVAGEVDINKAWAQISATNAHAIKSIGAKLTSSSSANNVWTRIRYSNLYLDNVDKYTGLKEDFKNQIKGQLYFWRAWNYFELVRLYGGVPLILTAQDPNIDDKNNEVPRSSSSETIDQIVSDLDMAQTLLTNGRPYTAAQAGRITAQAAAALKGRVLLTWASPLFNRNDDVERWQRAYAANLAAYNACLAAGKGLNPNWKTMWFQDNNMESIFAYGFNNDATGGQQAKNNATERKSRPRDLGADGTNSPTKAIVDAFPMSDGTPYNVNGDPNQFYKNRDPRFYLTFSYNGAIWPYKENPNYKNWTYYWKTNASGTLKSTETTANATGIYLRKFTNDNTSELAGFRYVGADQMEIRFAEVVLNLAESAIGINSLSEGKGYIKAIRARAGITNGDGDYGLANVSTRDQHFAAVINERKVEFAYENKRFHDLRRWLLFNDDFGMCTRLNQTPIEGSRRQGYYTIAKSNVTTDYVGATDPFKGASAPVINRDATTYPPGITTYSGYVDYLYQNHFSVIVRDNVDPTTFSFKWYNEYYFFGIYQDLLDTAPYLQQTTGWGGTFDPLK